MSGRVMATDGQETGWRRCKERMLSEELMRRANAGLEQWVERTET